MFQIWSGKISLALSKQKWNSIRASDNYRIVAIEFWYLIRIHHFPSGQLVDKNPETRNTKPTTHYNQPPANPPAGEWQHVKIRNSYPSRIAPKLEMPKKTGSLFNPWQGLASRKL